MKPNLVEQLEDLLEQAIADALESKKLPMTPSYHRTCLGRTCLPCPRGARLCAVV